MVDLFERTKIASFALLLSAVYKVDFFLNSSELPAAHSPCMVNSDTHTHALQALPVTYNGHVRHHCSSRPLILYFLHGSHGLVSYMLHCFLLLVTCVTILPQQCLWYSAFHITLSPSL